ncbi:MAG: outer membrane beta-barrel protein, partial [Limisphaerales bacterium]
YSRLERASEQFYGRGAYFLAEATQVGVEASGSLTSYASGERSDYQTVSLGPFVDWTLTEYLRITARGGYTMQFFEENGLFAAPDDTDSYYLGLSVAHQLTQAISHDLSGEHGLDTGIDAQSVQRTSLGYGIRWRLMDPLTASFNTSVEMASETKTAFGAGEDYTRLGFGCGLAYAMTAHLSSSIGYQYYQRDSDLERNNYDQNLVTLMIGYRF